jgi:hypothetical protein
MKGMSLRKFSHMTFVLGTSVALAACLPKADPSAETGTKQNANTVENGMTRAEKQQAADREYELKAQGLANEDKRLTMQQKANEAKDLLSAQTAEENAKVNLDRQSKDLEGRKYEADAGIREADVRANAQKYQADKQYSTMNKVIESAGPVMQAMGAINNAAAASKRADAAERREDSRVVNDGLRAEAMKAETENERLRIILESSNEKTEAKLTEEIQELKSRVEEDKADVVSKRDILKSQREDLARTLSKDGSAEDTAKTQAAIAAIDSEIHAAGIAERELDRYSKGIGGRSPTGMGVAEAHEMKRSAKTVYDSFNEREGVKNLVSSAVSASTPAPTTATQTGMTTSSAPALPAGTGGNDPLMCFETPGTERTTVANGSDPCKSDKFKNMQDLLSGGDDGKFGDLEIPKQQFNSAAQAKQAVEDFFTKRRDRLLEALEAWDLSQPGLNAQSEKARILAAYDAQYEEDNSNSKKAALLRLIDQNFQAPNPDINAINKLIKDRSHYQVTAEQLQNARKPASTATTSAADLSSANTYAMRFQPGDKYPNPHAMMVYADRGDNSYEGAAADWGSLSGKTGTCSLIGAQKEC